MVKELFFIVAFSMTSTTVASEIRQASIIERSVPAFDSSSSEGTLRGENLQGMFLKTPFSDRVKITSTFGYRPHPISGKWAGHQGIDYAAPKGTPIQATAQGKVAFIGRQSGYGNVIFIEHAKGYSTVYAHQNRFKKGLKQGTNIEKGQIIGYVGSTGISTGPHLHYELRIDDRPVDPSQTKQQLASYIRK
jgi:murein DD-endopeptidase MepM/ murein hydrolase activator NlpD